MAGCYSAIPRLASRNAGLPIGGRPIVRRQRHPEQYFNIRAPPSPSDWDFAIVCIVKLQPLLTASDVRMSHVFAPYQKSGLFKIYPISWNRNIDCSLLVDAQSRVRRMWVLTNQEFGPTPELAPLCLEFPQLTAFIRNIPTLVEKRQLFLAMSNFARRTIKTRIYPLLSEISHFQRTTQK